MTRRMILITMFLVAALTAHAQTTSFTYQGKLTDGGADAAGQYDMIFKLFSAASGGSQIGSDASLAAVQVTSGIFTVNLDFGAGAFPQGSDRYLEIYVRHAAAPPGPAYEMLSPRQRVTSSPFAIRSMNTNLADGLSASCTLCVTDANIASIDGSKVTGTVANATTAGNVTGIVQIANGGTGSNTKNFFDGTGTTNTVPKFTGTRTMGNSSITDDGSTVTVNAVINISSPSNAIGNLHFSAANPYIVASSYFVAPGGAYFNSGTVYFQTQAQFRGGIHNDSNPFLTIDGGTSGATYISGSLGIGITNPSAPLGFPNSLGKKVVLYPGATGDAGFGVFANELRIASDYSGANITFGYDDRTTGFAQRMVLTGTGDLTASGSMSGTANTSSNFGIIGSNSDVNGTGLSATGNNTGGFRLIAGSGVASTGLTTGVYARSNSSGANTQALFADNNNTIVRVGFWNGTTFFKINGTGTVSTVVSDEQQNKRIMFAPEAPEVLFEDYGSGKLVDGRARIDLEPALATNLSVNERHPLRVFIQLEGDCNGVYVTNKSGSGFDVVELMNGKSNVGFSWHIVANRADEELSGPTLANGTTQKRISHYADLRFPLQADDAQVVSTPSTAAENVKKP